MARIGLSLQPDDEFLELLAPVIETEVEFLEIAPETTWVADAAGVFHPNGYHREFATLADRCLCPVVAHGVGLSLGTMDQADAPRMQRWLDRIALDRATFDYQWYTDHLGATVLDGRQMTLPIALPMTAAAARVVRDRLAAVQKLVPDVGFENSVFYFLLGDWMEEPAFYDSILGTPGQHLLLDLHNVYTMALNQDADPYAWLTRVDCTRVIEIHLSGGSRSDPAWLPDGATLRLDSHDTAIPEAVWDLFQHVAPRCPNLRGVCIERMEGTVAPADVPLLREELQRAKRVVP